MSSSSTNLLFRLLFICIVLDISMRYFDKPPLKSPSRKEKPKKEDKYENPLKDVEIDTSLDEDDDNYVDVNKKKTKKSKKIEKEEEINEDKAEKKEKKEKKSKKKRKIEEYDDEDEYEERGVLSIEYDKKSFQKYCEKLKNEIMGNFTSLDVEEKEYPLPSGKQFFSKFTFFTQMGINLFIFSSSKFKEKLTMIPNNVFDIVEKNKWVIMIGNFLGHQWLNKFLSTSGAFEVYYNSRLIFSKLSSNRLPSEADIHKIIHKYVKKSKKKAKKDDDDEDF